MVLVDPSPSSQVSDASAEKALLFGTFLRVVAFPSQAVGAPPSEKLAEIFSPLKLSVRTDWVGWPCPERETEREADSEPELKSTFVFLFCPQPQPAESAINFACVTFTPFLVQFLTFCFVPLFLPLIDIFASSRD